MKKILDLNPRFVAEVAAWRYGWWPLAAMGMAFIALFLFLYSEFNLTEKIQANQKALQVLETRAANLSHAIDALQLGSQTAGEQALNEIRDLPKRVAMPQQMNKIASLARSSGLSIGNIDFKPQAVSSPLYVGTSTTIALKGNYLQIKRFVRDAWVNTPSLTVDSISLQRASSDQEVVETLLTFTLWSQP